MLANEALESERARSVSERASAATAILRDRGADSPGRALQRVRSHCGRGIRHSFGASIL